AVAVTACQFERDPHSVYTTTGQNLGEQNYKAISASQSKVSFAGDDPVKLRESQALSDRYKERITFKSNAVLSYSKLYRGGFGNAWSDADNIKTDVESSAFYKNRGIVFDAAKIKSGGFYTYLLQSSTTYNCFVFRGRFGDGIEARANSSGDQEITGSLCYPIRSKSLDALEREMTDLLGRARFDGGAGNRAQSAATIIQ
ncbi:MAG: hypothetical protein JO010_01615, partial [Alphaproteobacteria bacterium]|nr:hypothetical protein [Alphaproteobacteria bacterium]